MSEMVKREKEMNGKAFGVNSNQYVHEDERATETGFDGVNVVV